MPLRVQRGNVAHTAAGKQLSQAPPCFHDNSRPSPQTPRQRTPAVSGVSSHPLTPPNIATVGNTQTHARHSDIRLRFAITPGGGGSVLHISRAPWRSPFEVCSLTPLSSPPPTLLFQKYNISLPVCNQQLLLAELNDFTAVSPVS